MDYLTKKIVQIAILAAIVIMFIGGIVYIINLTKENTRLESNYNAQVYATKFWKSKSGEHVARTAILQLTTSEMKNSKDKEIKTLYDKAKELGLKNRKLETLLSIKADTIIQKEVDVDTLFSDHDIMVYQDSLSIGDLHILRQQEVGTLKAKYVARYNPTIYVYITWSKEDKWKLKNLFVPRTKTYFVDVVTSDKLINVTNIKAITKH